MRVSRIEGNNDQLNRFYVEFSYLKKDVEYCNIQHRVDIPFAILIT